MMSMAAEGVLGLSDHPVDVGHVAHISVDGQALPAQRLDRNAGLLHVLGVDVGHGHVGPGIRKLQRDGPAHATSSAGNHRNLVL